MDSELTDITCAFTTRIPLAVLIVLGLKQWENRSVMPKLTSGRCAISCSRNSDEVEYSSFISWANRVFPVEVSSRIPTWDEVSAWQGCIVATCNYEVSRTPGHRLWNEGYPFWWKLSNVRRTEKTYECKGNVGMWPLEKGLITKTQPSKCRTR